MAKQSNKTYFANSAIALFITLSSSLVFADRSPPEDVPPVVYEGVRYECPHYSECDQNGGCVVAYDDVTGEQLWKLQVYCTHYQLNLERDVQNVYITDLEIENGKLAVTNEKSLQFAIDPQTLTVTGDPRGCDQGGCNVLHFRSKPAANNILWLGSVVLLWVCFRRRGPRCIDRKRDSVA